MRMTVSLLAATVVHGALFGVAAIVLSRGSAPIVVPTPVEVEVVAARPDPIADTAPAATTAHPEPAPVRSRIIRRPREVALVGAPTPAPTDSAAVVDAPSAPAATTPVSSPAAATLSAS